MKLFIGGEVVLLRLKKGKRRKRKKKKVFQPDLNPDPPGCSLAVLPLYHDVSHTVEAHSLTNY